MEYEGYEDVDYVLVYETDLPVVNNNNAHKLHRQIFLSNLMKIGVSINEVNGIKDHNLRFVLISLSWNVLIRYADLLKMKMPLKTHMKLEPRSKFGRCHDFLTSMMRLPSKFSKQDLRYLSVFRCDKIAMFDIKSKKTFFPKSKRILIAYELLSRTQWSSSADDAGIERLINSGVFWTAYPLHEGRHVCKPSSIDDPLTDRQVLYEFWARPGRFYKRQPITLIRQYFGEKVAIYFAWLGFFTIYLIPAAVIGFLGFIYALFNMGKYDISQDICNRNESGSFLMCPLCDFACSYWYLYESCIWAKIAKVFDNDFTIIYAIFMSIWAAIYLQSWVRKEAQLQYDWGVHDFVETEIIRYEYEIRCADQKINYITGEMEWFMPLRKKLPRIFSSGVSVLMMVCAVMAAMVGVISFRISMLVVLSQSKKLDWISSYSKLATAGLTATLNLVIILLLDTIYRIIATWMTDFENPRTESEYDDSLTLKMYIFEFFNFYSSLFYIAFFKGSFIGRPGNYNHLFGKRQEECDPAGCLVELSIQMLIIFVGKQVVNNVMEFILPFIKSWFRNLTVKIKHSQRKMPNLRYAMQFRNHSPQVDPQEIKLQWEKDYKLMDTQQLDLFDEYLEMVIQYGFVTMFAAVMPLAPLFALLNNIIEIRLDAYKMLVQWRRPRALSTNSIGIWDGIMRTITSLAVITNAFIISYTSNAIPEIVYRFYYSDSVFNLHGFVNFSLSFFNVSDFEPPSIPNYSDQFPNVTVCRYRDMRMPPWGPDKYQFSIIFWHILAARLAFVIVFEHVVFMLAKLIDWLIPDISKFVKIRMQQDKFINKKLFLETNRNDLQKILMDLPSPSAKSTHIGSVPHSMKSNKSNQKKDIVEMPEGDDNTLQIEVPEMKTDVEDEDTDSEASTSNARMSFSDSALQAISSLTKSIRVKKPLVVNKATIIDISPEPKPKRHVTLRIIEDSSSSSMRPAKPRRGSVAAGYSHEPNKSVNPSQPSFMERKDKTRQLYDIWEAPIKSNNIKLTNNSN